MHKAARRTFFQIGLFITTFITTTLAGTEWVYSRSVFVADYSWQDFVNGLQFSIPLLLILTVHEFGHYFTALFHKVKTSLPYYIPLPPIPFLPLSIGTMGAVIRLRSRPKSNLQNFDIGLAGPIAGFIVAIIILFYAFKTLPPGDYVFQFHPEYEQYGPDYAEHVYDREYLKGQPGLLDVQVGSNLIFLFFEKVVADPERVPNHHEIMHYPVLLACYIALFVTCLNLLPIGQLDGGHVVYGLFGFKIHRTIATVFFIALIFYAGLGLPYIRLDFKGEIFGLPGLAVSLPLYLYFLHSCLKGLRLAKRDTFMYALLIFAAHFVLANFFPAVSGYEGWLLFAFILGRFIGIQHPPSEVEQPLDPGRVMLGWITLLIFILCFSPAPIMVNVVE